MHNFSLRHYDHEARALGEVIPSNFSYTWPLGEPGTVTYELSLDHPAIEQDSVRAHLTDWILLRDDTPIMGGEHTGVAPDEGEGNFLQISGESWLAYLGQRIYPFDPTTPTVFQRAGVDVFTIVEDMLRDVLAKEHSLTIHLSGETCGKTANFRIDFGDTEFVLTKIQTLSEQKSALFDFEVTWDRKWKMYHPRKGEQSALILQRGVNFDKFPFEDKGIKGNAIFATGAGSARRLVKLVTDTASMAAYRRRDAPEDFGDVNNADLLQQLAEGALDHNASVLTEFTLDITPNAIDEVWEKITPGDSVRVISDEPYTMIDEFYRCIGFEGGSSEQGDEHLTLHFNNEV